MNSEVEMCSIIKIMVLYEHLKKIVKREEERRREGEWEGRRYVERKEGGGGKARRVGRRMGR